MFNSLRAASALLARVGDEPAMCLAFRVLAATSAMVGVLGGLACGGAVTKTAPSGTETRESDTDGGASTSAPPTSGASMPAAPTAGASTPGIACAATAPGPVTLTKGPQGGGGIVVDANNVYWTAMQVSNGFTGGLFGEVMQCSKCGCKNPIVLVNETSYIPQGIAVDSTYVYWGSTDEIMRVPIGGGARTTFASTQAVGGIVSDANDLYWSNGKDAVMKAPREGGRPTVVANATASAYVAAVDATNVYWTDMSSGTISKAPVGGGAATVLATGQSAGALALDATNVYWTNYDNDQPGATVMTIPIAGGTPTTLASGIRGPAGIAVGRSSVYWTSDNAVKEVPLGGGATTTLVPSNAYQAPMGIVADSTSVYWVDVISGAIVRMTQD
jgi:hypothetical protein